MNRRTDGRVALFPRPLRSDPESAIMALNVEAKELGRPADWQPAGKPVGRIHITLGSTPASAGVRVTTTSVDITCCVT